MKTLRFLLGIAAIALISSASAATAYQCPMHPWIKSDHPGKCTICGMDLVAASSNNAAADPNVVPLPAASATTIGLQTDAVRRGTLVRTLRVTGIVDDDDTRHRILAARVPGRVEKLFINFVGAEVREGEPLATIYSPEMLTAQRTYVERLRAGNVAFTASERSAARERLLELGLTEEEVNILEHTLEPVAMVNVRAPMTGTVVSRAAYEGQYVQTNDRLFEIGDFSTMWFVFDAHEPDLAWLRTGQTVEISLDSQPGHVLTAPISFIDPNLDPAMRTARVRVVLPNRDRSLYHKQTGIARVKLEVPNVLLAPRSAVLQHGASPVVFVPQGDSGYAARRVQVGRMGDRDAEILAGLSDGERVVTEAGLLLDGQAQLARAAVSGEVPPAPAPETAPMAAAMSDDGGYAQLKPLALAAADAALALASDDLASYKKQVPAIDAALKDYFEHYAHAEHGALAKFQKGLADEPADLRAARREFEPFSTALADIAREQKLPQKEGLHVFQCPMSPVLGTGRWLSRNTDTKNPFFGSAMLECGEELK